MDNARAMAPPTADLPQDQQEGVQFALKLGRALHIYGAPANRLEAVMNVLSQEMGLKAHSMAMPTALMVSFDLPGEDGYAHLYRLHRNEQDFDKLARLDQLWNEVVDKRMTPTEGIRKIDEIDEQPPLYGRTLQMLCFGLSSATASTFFGGGPNKWLWGTTYDVNHKKSPATFYVDGPGEYSIFIAGRSRKAGLDEIHVQKGSVSRDGSEPTSPLVGVCSSNCQSLPGD